MDGEGERFLRIHGGPLYEACRHYRRNLYDVEGQEEAEEVEDFLLDRGTGRVYLLLPEVEAPGLLEEMVRRRFFDVLHPFAEFARAFEAFYSDREFPPDSMQWAAMGVPDQDVYAELTGGDLRRLRAFYLDLAAPVKKSLAQAVADGDPYWTIDQEDPDWIAAMEWVEESQRQAREEVDVDARALLMGLSVYPCRHLTSGVDLECRVRTWRERLLSWPWHPLRRQDVRATPIPDQKLYVIEDGKGQATMVVGHPETIARLQEALE